LCLINFSDWNKVAILARKRIEAEEFVRSQISNRRLSGEMDWRHMSEVEVENL
jgi:hypothetical protein